MAIWTEAEATALTMSYLDELDLLGRAVGEAIRSVFDAMSAYDRAQLAEWVERVTPVARAGAAEGADLAGAYLAELTGKVAPTVTNLTLPALEGPFHHMWHELKKGMEWNQARDAGASHADMMGYDSPRGGAGDQFARPPTGVRVIGYQRMLHPGACEWCQVVATQIYRTQASGTFGHRKCQCVPPVPVTTENAKALRAINSSQLRSLKRSGATKRVSEARERSRQRERDARVAALEEE